jgi:hypothetical protein
MEFRKFRNKQFGAKRERFPTANPDWYQIRELGVYGSGNYGISPLADDTSYEIKAHKGAGHWENRAFDIPVPISSKQGDKVAEFWRRRGYRVIWNNGDGIHHNHVHVEVPKAKAAEFFRIINDPKPKPRKPPSEVSSSISDTPSYQRVAVAAPVEQPPSTPIVIGGGGQQMVASGPSRRDLTNRSSQVRFNSRLWSA